MKIDILLPIYNSPSETRTCIESIIKNTPEESYVLYLLDDCSSDTTIQDITKYYNENYNNIFVYRNANNQGFPGNVNRGFKKSNNDVVIINSDTIVTIGWLEGLKQAAYSSPNIGAVGPLSNYGMVTAVPTIYQKINENIDMNKIVNFIKYSTNDEFFETPILIGFCMYIKRKALNEIGFFDAETFKKGYGEETDWCLRARNKGFKLVIAVNSYVYHVGAVSFGEHKIKLQEYASRIIEERYPTYKSEIKEFELNHPLTELRINMSRQLRVPIRYRIRYNLRRKKILLKNTLKIHSNMKES